MNELAAVQEKTQSEDSKLQIRRVIKARRSRVFESWTRPELMQHWFAPGEMRIVSASADLHLGGQYRVEIRGVDDAVFVASGVYRKIIPNELLSFTWAGGCDPGAAETLVTVEFRDFEGGTELVLTHEHFGSADAMARHQQGWTGSLDNLEKFLRAME